MRAKNYLSEMSRTLERMRSELVGMESLCGLAESSLSDDQTVTDDLPAYLVFMILANVRKLRDVSPDHILVSAVQAALDAAQTHKEIRGDQLPLDL